MMKKLWPILKQRPDIEGSFLLMIGTGILLATMAFVLAEDLRVMADYIPVILGVAFLISTVYFFIALSGYNKIKSRKKK